MVVNASSEAGSALSTTDHWLRPLDDAPAGFAETTPGVDVIACSTSAVFAVEAMTRVGSVRPLGKWSASVSYPLTDSACTRNCSVCERPTGVVARPRHSSIRPVIATAETRAGLRATASATRCQMPLSVRAFAPTLGTNGQNSRLPNSASSGGSTSSTNTAATTSPAAACTPRLRVLGDDASTSVSSASTTVALLARIAGPAWRTATLSASRWFSLRPNSSRYREINSRA